MTTMNNITFAGLTFNTRVRQMIFFLLFIVLFQSLSAQSVQEEKTLIHHGNKNYEKGQFDEAEKNYKKALEKNNNSLKGTYNLADALYKQGKYAEAAGLFESITNRKISSDTLAKAYHNLGNSLLRQKKYEESINAYKKALKNSPDDDETRYNLAYALQMLKQEQQKQQQNKDDQKDQNKDKQDQNKQKEKKEKEDKQEKEQTKNKISPEDAKRLLDALNNEEKKTQEKLKKQKAKGSKTEIEKDW